MKIENMNLSEGLSEGIERFLEDLDTHDYRIHALMIALGENVVYGSAADPYTLDTPHRLFSSAKSILVLGVMKAIEDRKLRPTDKVADFFHEYEIKDSRLRNMTVEDLLTMRTGQEDDPFGLLFQNFDTDLFHAFFQTRTVEEPGITFRYNNTVPHLVYGTVEKAVKEPFEQYQNRHFCRPLNAPIYAPMNSKRQYNPVIACTSASSFLKYAQLFLNEGTYLGKQYLRPETIREATCRHTFTGMDGNNKEYGWQIWMNEFGGYRMDGGWGQFAFILPKEHAAVVVMSDMTDCNYLVDSFEHILLPAISLQNEDPFFQASKIPELSSLAPSGNAVPDEEIFGVLYKGEGNSLKLIKDKTAVKVIQNGNDYEVGLQYFCENKGYISRPFSIDHSVYGPDKNKVMLAGAFTKPNEFVMKGKCFAEMGETYCKVRFEEERCVISYTPMSVHGISERLPHEWKEVILWRNKKNCSTNDTCHFF